MRKKKKLSIVLVAVIITILCITVFLSVKHKKQEVKQEENMVWEVYLEVMGRDVDSGNIK